MSTQQDLGVAASVSTAPSPTQAAFERALPAAMALPENEVVSATTNTPDAIIRVFSALPGLRTLLGDTHRSISLFDPNTVDRFELHAHALSFAQSRYLQSRASSSVDVTRATNKAQTALNLAFGDLQAMLNRKMVDPARVASIKRSISNRESLPVVIGAVVQLMAELRATYGERMLMTEAEQNDLAQLGEELSKALAGGIVVKFDDNPLDTRNRMFTLLRRDYLELRRTVEYLRFYEEDADEILPTIFTRAKRKARAEEDAPSDDSTEKQEGQTEPRALELRAC